MWIITVKPVVHPARRVPFALKEKLKAELNRMVSLGVIEKVDKPTAWVNSIVIVEKSNGDIRLCLDPKDLNRAVKREFSQMPTAEEIMSRMISRCPACIKYQQAQKKQPLKPHDVPAEPWYKVGMDLATYKNKDYLVIVDYFSNYPEVCPLNNTRSSTIISHVKSIFSRHGFPKIVISDNGPQFSSLEFKQFAKKWEFTHTTSSPEYPRSNDMAESAVKIVKKIFKRTECMGDDAYLALLAHRATPSTNDTRSPAEKLMGRNIRTPLPDLRKMVYGKKDCRDTELPVKFNPAYKRKRKQYYDRPTNQLPEVPVESTVRIRDKEKGTWPLKAKVLGNANTPRSLFVESEKGSTLRRNRQD